MECDCLTLVLGQSPSQELCTVRPVSSLRGGKATEWVGGEGEGRLRGRLAWGGQRMSIQQPNEAEVIKAAAASCKEAGTGSSCSVSP